ncbi:hypothetical protein BAZ12_06390 [Elizabethkingia miricola]|uniref:Anti-sigma factor n=1 Tax=Elizabethkingia miricola TaxID=172045 RepID=A0ABD4DLM6_ELIMR|nr:MULTISPECIES: hypothetical protein [Elizabethkingia]KUY19375.1 hypothetical protein ATB95_00050 [Elizabethkingia miricola]MCL1650985.1 hypothetical protein [Elizabethkingia miricola]MCL1678104.1 hypothetical protein [Elizabethkingia miricola]OPC71657.1 hypothetical protein BAZ13_09455 [Elizabethkingia miricola]OPC73403.1 hypothetical protein BAZ12_06390 [Elizabethkingia miricola]
MKTDRSKQYKDQYFAGNSSEAEEKWLKDFSDDVFFKTLREEKEVTMDWSFEDFMEKVEEQPIPVKKIQLTTKPGLSKWYWMAAGFIIFLSLGGYLFFNQKSITEVTATSVAKNEPVKNNTPAIQEQQTTPPEINIQPPVITPETEKKEITEKENIKVLAQKKPLVKKEKEIIETTSVKSVPETGTEDGYNPNYVLINGKPVYDEEEAADLTKKSLNLLASNLDKGIEKVGLIKHLSVNF